MNTLQESNYKEHKHKHKEHKNLCIQGIFYNVEI